jgi:hypothetical protein
MVISPILVNCSNSTFLSFGESTRNNEKFRIYQVTRLWWVHISWHPQGRCQEVVLSVQKSTSDFWPLKPHNVTYLPHNRVNTISTDLLERKDVFWQGQIKQFVHLPSVTEFASCRNENGMNIFEVWFPNPLEQNVMVITEPALHLRTLHGRLGRLYDDAVQILVKSQNLPPMSTQATDMLPMPWGKIHCQHLQNTQNQSQ